PLEPANTLPPGMLKPSTLQSPWILRSMRNRSTTTSRCYSAHSPIPPIAAADPGADEKTQSAVAARTKEPVIGDNSMTSPTMENTSVDNDTVRLTANQYGKAENRVVRVYRDTKRHSLRDLNVTSQLRGDFQTAHTEGDNGNVVPTDTQKNTVFAKAKEEGIDSPEQFLLSLADHFTSNFDWVSKN